MKRMVRLRIEVVGEDGDACRRLLRGLCDVIDADVAGAPGYDVSRDYGNASCEVDTVLPNAPALGEPRSGDTQKPVVGQFGGG